MLTIGRAAVLTQPKPGRGACHYCGPCHRGCSTRSYFSAINSTLPAAQATGRMTLQPFSVVRSLAYDAKRHRISGVHVIDAQSGKALKFTARIVFVGASAIESARPLLNSATPEFANGLANSSDQVGRNIMDHIKCSGASGEFDGWTDKQVIGERPNGIYVPRFRNVHAKHADFIRGYGFHGGAGRSGWQSATRAAGIGLACKARPTQLGPWSMSFNGFDEMLPNGKNRATAHPTLKDRWGIPSLHIECEWSANELAIHRDMNVTGVELLEAAGAKHVQPSTRGPSTPGNANHEMGTARMGRDRKSSVLNEWNQSWDIPNLFMTDGAAMTSSSCQNPSLTYMALTARAARALHAIRNCYTSAELSDVHGDLLFVRAFPDSIEIFDAAGIALRRIEPALKQLSARQRALADESGIIGSVTHYTPSYDIATRDASTEGTLAWLMSGADHSSARGRTFESMYDEASLPVRWDLHGSPDSATGNALTVSHLALRDGMRTGMRRPGTKPARDVAQPLDGIELLTPKDGAGVSRAVRRHTHGGRCRAVRRRQR